jgi:hypothetical protein
VRALPVLERDIQDRLRALADRAARHLAQWNVPDPGHQARIEALRDEWGKALEKFDFSGAQPLDAAMRNAAGQSLDFQELLAAMVMEPFGDLVDGLCECMHDPGLAFCPPLSGTAALRRAIEDSHAWALAPAYDAPDQCGQFWYVSEAKNEPRLGQRFEEPGAELESPLDIGRQIKGLYQALPEADQPISAFLAEHPEQAAAVARVQCAQAHPYGEIRDNLIAASCLPIDMLRCKLAFFGASKFDPKSDRWTRITLCQGAPLADELGPGADDWWLPVFAP